MTTRMDYAKARSPLATEAADTHIEQTRKSARRHKIGRAVAKGAAKRKRDAANEAARIQALGNGEVFAPTTIRREPKATPTPTSDQPPDPPGQDPKEYSRAQACSDAKREALRSNAIRPVLDGHPQFPGRRRDWRPNRRQRKVLAAQGLL